jgi:hypothetical protein
MAKVTSVGIQIGTIAATTATAEDASSDAAMSDAALRAQDHDLTTLIARGKSPMATASFARS